MNELRSTALHLCLLLSPPTAPALPRQPPRPRPFLLLKNSCLLPMIAPRAPQVAHALALGAAPLPPAENLCLLPMDAPQVAHALALGAAPAGGAHLGRPMVSPGAAAALAAEAARLWLGRGTVRAAAAAAADRHGAALLACNREQWVQWWVGSGRGRAVVAVVMVVRGWAWRQGGGTQRGLM